MHQDTGDQGVTDFFIVDNGPTDGTTALLGALSTRLPGNRWTRDDGPFDQLALTTGLAHDAVAAGVEWVVAVDADEFWSAGERGLPPLLRHATEEGVGGLEVGNPRRGGHQR